MPLPTQALGLPGTRVIPSGWTETHGRVIAGTWTAACTINEPAVRGPYDEDLGYSPMVPGAEVYAGPCRVQALPIRDAAQLVGGQEITTQDYLIVVPRSVDATVDHVVVVAEADDPSLVGKSFTVRAAAYGSLSWERDLTCTLDLG